MQWWIYGRAIFFNIAKKKILEKDSRVFLFTLALAPNIFHSLENIELDHNQ